MTRSFRQSQFRQRSTMGEDVNPSAYIVNLADCMLVLACGFMVALISYWNIDVSAAQKLNTEDMKEVAPEEMAQDITNGGGSYYVQAGVVYRDPNTGALYMVEGDQNSSTDSSANSSTGSSSGSTSGSDSQTSSSGVSSTQNSRANGAD